MLSNAEGLRVEKNSQSLTRRNLSSSDSKQSSRLTFKKEERLTRRKEIERLFDNGKPVRYEGMLLYYAHSSESIPYPAQVAFGVPKRLFKRAVDRNRIKRLMREAYRQHKHTLYDYLKLKEYQLVLMMVYNSSSSPSYKEIEEKIITLLDRLKNSGEIDTVDSR